MNTSANHSRESVQRFLDGESALFGERRERGGVVFVGAFGVDRLAFGEVDVEVERVDANALRACG
jgi:hypothetical protein